MADSGGGMGGGGGTPWGSIFGMLMQQKELGNKRDEAMTSALGGGVHPQVGNRGNSGGGSGGSADKLLDLLGSDNQGTDNHNEDINRMMQQNQKDIDKLDTYGGKDFGNNQLPKKNYGLKLSDDSTYGLGE